MSSDKGGKYKIPTTKRVRGGNEKLGIIEFYLTCQMGEKLYA